MNSQLNHSHNDKLISTGPFVDYQNCEKMARELPEKISLLLQECGIACVDLISSNHTEDQKPYTLYSSIPVPFHEKDIDKDLTDTYDTFLRRLATEIIDKMTNENQIFYTLNVTSDVTGKTTVNLTYEDSPTFTGSYFSSNLKIAS